MILWRWKKLKVCNRLGAKGLRERNEHSEEMNGF